VKLPAWTVQWKATWEDGAVREFRVTVRAATEEKVRIESFGKLWKKYDRELHGAQRCEVVEVTRHAVKSGRG
jgi:hypothetical protein